MIEKMKADPLPSSPKTTPMITNKMLRNVVTTAASCGLLPKGAATKNDQLARTRPRRTCTARMRPVLVSAKMRKRQVKPTIIHAGR